MKDIINLDYGEDQRIQCFWSLSHRDSGSVGTNTWKQRPRNDRSIKNIGILYFFNKHLPSAGTNPPLYCS